mmetsp:Transcript_12610/g.38599  ORF Transcript_12610/g.38599 Transcript_12610/m.38599 type:complete len:222 (-) Transcript_12610:385-1050(-)
MVRALGPVISDGVSKDLSIRIERTRSDGLVHLLHDLQPGLCNLVPERATTVTANGCKRGVLLVKCNGVDGIDVVGLLVAVTLECEIALSILLRNVVDAHAAFDAADGKARGVWKCGNTPRLVLQLAVFLQKRGRWVSDVVNNVLSLSCSHNHQQTAHGHRIYSLADRHCSHRLAGGGSHIPVLHRLVPRTCGDARLIDRLLVDVCNAPNGLAVLGDRLRIV